MSFKKQFALLITILMACFFLATIAVINAVHAETNDLCIDRNSVHVEIDGQVGNIVAIGCDGQKHTWKIIRGDRV